MEVEYYSIVRDEGQAPNCREMSNIGDIPPSA